MLSSVEAEDQDVPRKPRIGSISSSAQNFTLMKQPTASHHLESTDRQCLKFDNEALLDSDLRTEHASSVVIISEYEKMIQKLEGDVRDHIRV